MTVTSVTDPIEFAIQAALLEIPVKAKAEQWPGERPWTAAVKSAIVKVGADFGWLTAANGCTTDEGKEWLYDVVWYQLDRADHMTDVPLVAESEFSTDERKVKEDFEKLLVAKSKYRVMIFQGSEKGVPQLIRKMHLWISKFHRTAAGDRYLLAGWAESYWVFEVVLP